MSRLMPRLRRNILEPLWARYSGMPLLKEWRALETSQRLPERVLRERQWKRLVEMVRFAYENNDFYRARLDRTGLAPAMLRSLDDFRKIPLLTKTEIREQGTALISRGFDPDRLRKFKTGGSTGKPLDLFATEEVSELRNACGRRHRRWSGWEVGEPVGAVWGNPQRAVTVRDKIREWLLSPVIYLDTMSVTQDAVEAFARDWSRMHPTLLFGHAHSIFILARMLRQTGIREIRPKAIIATSMMLVPCERAAIEDVFAVRVFDSYGCEEVGQIASECERHGGMHVNIEQIFVELVREDGTPVRPGEPGLVVVTDLLNRAMPLIRYRMEDMAEPTDRACACGRGLPLIGKISGRVADFLRRQDGSRVAGVSLIENSLTRIPGLEQMQIVQEDLAHICLRVVPGAGFTSERRRELVSYFAETFPGSRIETEDVAEIRPEPNGKYRFSICKVTD